MAKIDNMMSILWMLSSDKKVTAKQISEKLEINFFSLLSLSSPAVSHSLFGDLLQRRQLQQYPPATTFNCYTTIILFFFNCCDLFSPTASISSATRGWVCVASSRVVDGGVVVVVWMWELE